MKQPLLLVDIDRAILWIMRTTQTLIQHLGLMPHPEGGWYRELHRSPEQVQRQDGAERSALTAILFLLPAGAVSCCHRG